MNIKLKMKLNQETIKKAKQYASDKGMRLSNLVENFLYSLTSEKSINNNLQISTFIKSMSSKINLPNNYNFKKVRIDYLENKHK